MPTDMITLKLEREFLKEIDSVLKDARYQNRTEFIREALREKLAEIRVQQLREHFRKFRTGKPFSEEEYEQIRNADPDLDSDESKRLFRLVRGTDVAKR